MADTLAIDGGKPVREDFLVFGSPRIEEDEIAEVVDSLRSGWLSTGPKVAKFEDMFRDYIGSRHAVALHSCTAGIHLAMIVSGLRPGDEVITTSMTFAATANAITHVGARPVFVDIDLPSMNISPEKIEEVVTSKTKAVIPVHFAGRPCRMDEIVDLAKRYELQIIEDAAHAIEAVYHGRKIGSIGELSAFSFYVTKNLATGEGGMVTTDRDDYADRIKRYGLHGMSKGAWRRYSDEGFKHYHVVFPGYKYNMMDIQAAIGIRQLPKVESYLVEREKVWAAYDEAFADLPLEIPAPAEPDTRHARHLYTILLDVDRLTVGRDTIQEALFREGIGTGIHFVALHLHPFYAKTCGYRPGDFPNAEYVSHRTLSLPLSAKLTEEDVDDVIRAVRKVVSHYTK